jgi:hypothetical protein
VLFTFFFHLPLPTTIPYFEGKKSHHNFKEKRSEVVIFKQMSWGIFRTLENQKIKNKKIKNPV